MSLQPPASFLLAVLAAAAPPLLGGQDGARVRVPPEVGAVAKPLEQVNWYYTGPEGRIPAIADLRGQVVLVHTWGYYCPPCVSDSVPYVVDLMKAHRGRGLRAYSISVPISDGKPDEHCVEVGRAMGIDHPMGVADGYGAMTPYLNMNVNRALTWCFVIGREGGVRWAGDPSRDDEEFLEAVRTALFEEPLPPLPEEVPEPLSAAVRLYVARELARARDEAAKVLAKHEKPRQDAETAAAAAQLVEQIDLHREQLVERLEAAFAARDAEAFLAARTPLLERFPKTDAAKRIAELDLQVKRDEAFRRELDRWKAWDALRRSAPALFPIRADRETKRYAKELRKYVDGAEPDAPGLDEARKMIESFSAE